jgi:protein-S-isoprenylcysteine O-methyltransferase Ste14
VNRVALARGPGIRCHAPIVFLAALAVAWRLHRTWNLPIEVGGHGVVRSSAGWLLILGGFLLGAISIGTLVRARTTFLPDRESNYLVMAGPFAFSRNPIYVGMMAIYVGIALASNSAWPILLLPLVWIVMRAYIIAREERYLAGKFGETYVDYRRRVRRWL